MKPCAQYRMISTETAEWTIHGHEDSARHSNYDILEVHCAVLDAVYI